MSALIPPFKVIKVRDTRSYEEQGDRWVPIPGSGDAHECERCNRLHEIHATVQDTNGNYGTVGVGCMGAETAEVRRLSGQATRGAKRAAKDVAKAEASRQLDELIAAVRALPFPADRIEVGPAKFGEGEDWRLDGARVVVAPYADRSERMHCLEGSWRRSQLDALAGGYEAHATLARRAERPMSWTG
jgi:hypothetical protein